MILKLNTLKPLCNKIPKCFPISISWQCQFCHGINLTHTPVEDSVFPGTGFTLLNFFLLLKRMNFSVPRMLLPDLQIYCSFYLVVIFYIVVYNLISGLSKDCNSLG